MSVSERRFGVEIECGVRNKRPLDIQSLFEDNGLLNWSVGSDGSGIEARTPILQGEEGFETLWKAMELLTEHEAFTTREDGMHVHHDGPEFIWDIDKQIKLAKSWVYNQAYILDFVDKSKRRMNSYCRLWNETDLFEMERVKVNPYQGRGRPSLNLHALQAHGSIEFRLHEGTLDFTQARAWIEFGQALMDFCAKEDEHLPKAKSHQDLLEMVKCSEATVITLVTRAERQPKF